MKFRRITKDSPMTLPLAEVVGIVLHWTAGHYRQVFHDYHFCIGPEGEILQNDADLPGTTIFHTWRRNTGTIGIAACAMAGATAFAYMG